MKVFSGAPQIIPPGVHLLDSSWEHKIGCASSGMYGVLSWVSLLLALQDFVPPEPTPGLAMSCSHRIYWTSALGMPLPTISVNITPGVGIAGNVSERDQNVCACM